jgi:hypothetical protein
MQKQIDIQDVVSRVLSETVLSISQARAELGNISGDRPDKSTMIRWIIRGANGVRLDGCKVSREWVTSVEAINRFIVARTQQAMGGKQSDPMAKAKTDLSEMLSRSKKKSKAST